MTPSGTFLTEQEIQELTGCKVRQLQTRWLASRGWPFEIDHYNRPVVLRSVMVRKSQAKAPTKETPWGGQVPDDWFKDNRHQFVRDKIEIIQSATPTDDVTNKCYDCAVYFLIKGESVIYVGQSNSLSRRTWQHLDDWKDFDFVSWIPVPKLFLEAVESYYIYLFKPPLNKRFPVVDYLMEDLIR